MFATLPSLKYALLVGSDQVDIFLNQLVKFYSNSIVNLHPLNYTHYAKLYPQNGEHIVIIDYVTSFHPVYNSSTNNK